MEVAAFRSHRLVNALHALLLLGGLAALLVGIGWVLAGAAGMLWAAVFGTVALWITPRVSPTLVLRLYRARPLTPADVPGLHELVERLASLAELPRAPRLYYVPSPILNAFSVGRRADAAVALTDGLLRGLPPRELTAVLAHEISHIRHDDMWIMSLADSASRIVRGMSLVGQLLILFNLPALVMEYQGVPWLLIVLLLAAPTLSALLQLALSRNREFDADLEAVRLTGDAQGLAQALRLLEHHQERLWRHMLFPGYRNRQPSLLRTHPATEARIERLRTLFAGSDDGPRGDAAPGWGAAGFVAGSLPAGWTQPLRARHRWHGLWY